VDYTRNGAKHNKTHLHPCLIISWAEW